MSSKNKTITNVTWSFIMRIMVLVGQFILQSFFVRYLSINYLGVNGLFTNVISFLSFAELGIGAAVTFALYKPLSEQDDEAIASVVNFYKKAYRIIGFVVFFVGMIVMTFLPALVKKSSDVPNIRYLFLIYLLGTVSSYFFTYYRSLLIANQQSYINIQNQAGFKVVQMIVQAAAIALFHRYDVYLWITVIFTVASNVHVAYIAKKWFPDVLNHMKKAKPIPKNQITEIKNNVIGSFASKVGTVIVFSTDNLLIAKFSGLVAVGQYSNYALIIQGITTVLNEVYSSIIATFGNASLKQSSKANEDMLLQYMYFVGLVSALIVAEFELLVQGFIGLWIGKDYLLIKYIVVLIIVSFTITELRIPVTGFTAALGLYWHTRFKSLIEAASNLIFSLVMIKISHDSITGVLWGTILSNIVINSWWEPYILYSKGIQLRMTKYWRTWLGYMAFFAAEIAVFYYLLDLIVVRNYLELVGFAVIIAIIVAIIFILVFWNKDGRKILFTAISSRGFKKH